MHNLSGQIAATALALVACAAMPTASNAQTYKAGDIVRHFQPATPPSQASATRSICVGTEVNCPSVGNAVKPAVTAAFDLVVRFKYNSDVLEPDARVNLDEFAKALKAPQLASSSFVVEGHTDATGTPSYNLDLSERRAQAVVRYLGEAGVAASKLLARGYGQSRPVAADPFSADNRRVETRLRID